MYGYIDAISMPRPSIRQVLRAAKQRLKEAYNGQPSLVITQPLRTKQHSVRQFEMKGVILETWKNTRKICKSGTGLHINIPCNWADLLTEPLQLHLYQTDRKGIIIEEAAGGES